jgi:hypothetical protein
MQLVVVAVAASAATFVLLVTPRYWPISLVYAFMVVVFGGLYVAARNTEQ